MKTSHTEQGLPHWDMSAIFPSLSSSEFHTAITNFVAQLTNLEQQFNRLNIGQIINPVPDSSDTFINKRVAVPNNSETFAFITDTLNEVLDTSITLRNYITAFVSTNAANAQAQACLSELEGQLVRITRLRSRYDAWVGSQNLTALLNQSETARQHEFVLVQAQRRAEHQMSEAEEDLAARLSLSGGKAWAALHNNFTADLMVSVPLPTGAEQLPMSSVRNLAAHPDASVRKAAYQVELAAWENAAMPLAAAMNGVKGEVVTLLKRRSYNDALEPALLNNNMDRETLEAMHTACVASFPDFRHYLHTKAKALGQSTLPWYDMLAPLPSNEVGDNVDSWPFNKGKDFILAQFGTYSPRLRDFAVRAFAENWIDAQPQKGKRDGAFCMSIRPGESRILSNYSALSFSSVSTLAHELGHGYHNLCLAKRTALQRVIPMALAETASIFCQTLVTQAALKAADPDGKRSILETDLKNACQVVVDIHSRFLFEQRVFAARERRELSVAEFNELMLTAQRETYGNGLDETYLHPYMWAVKPHYYSVERSFYNFPYTFGLLFGLGLYAQYEQDPNVFRQRYDELLSATGLADAVALTSQFGFDIRKPEFWQASLNIIKRNIATFAELVG